MSILINILAVILNGGYFDDFRRPKLYTPIRFVKFLYISIKKGIKPSGQDHVG